MKRKLLLICLLITAALSSTGQTTTVTQPADFYTTDQSLWMQGNSGLVDIDIPFFDVSWNESGSIGGITTIAGFPFGAVVNAGTWGQIGSGLRIEFGNERVDVDYISDINLTMPADGTFEKGDEITISTALDPDEANSSITRDEYNVLFQIWMAIGFGFDIGGQFCFFDCANGTIVDIDMPVDTLDLVYISNSTGVSVLEGLWEWPISNLPISFSDDDGIVTLTLDLPSNAGETTWFSGNNMISASTPYEYASLEFNVCKFIGALNIPYVSAVFANLENEWELGPVTVGYTLMDMVFKLGLYHNQRLTFKPTVKATMTFPGNVDYKVLTPANSVVTTGTASAVTLDVGNKLRFRYPCNYDFMEIDPYYVMRNDFNNHTYDSIAFDFIFDMLEFHISMDDIEVIPQICIPIYEPCGPWYCYICDWCFAYNWCTPAVVFPGFTWGFGPLVHLQPNIFNVKYDWVNSHWEMLGFNDVDGAKFRIEPAKFVVTVAPTDAPCFGVNGGAATANVVHGKPPYRYEWSNGTVHNISATTDAVSGLSAGTHYVIVTDANGCVTFCSFVIGQPAAALAVESVLTNVSCNGTPTGSVNITTTGGTAPYGYNWSNTATSEDLLNVVAGTYTLTVTDSHGCTNVSSYTLTQPYALISTPSSTNVECYGSSTGTASVSTTGGTPPYEYQWSTTDTTAAIINIPAGAYSVTVTDFNGCQNVLNYNITQPSAPIAISVTTQDVFCNGESTGSVTVAASGGTAPYSYEWFRNGQSLNHSASNLGSIAVGDYKVIITDANGCTRDTTVHIAEPPAIAFNLSVIDNLCFGETNGSITLSVNGGTGTYTYNWSNGASTANIGSLAAGTYDVTITDNNGCHQYAQTVIAQPGAPLTAAASPTHVLCKGNPAGSVNLIVQGGTAPYFFLWSNGSAVQNPDGLTAGTYTVTITDNNGCVAYSGTVINEPADSLSASYNIDDALCFGSSDGQITALVSGGTTPYYIRWDDTDYLMQNNGHKLENLISGYYQIIVTDANGCKSLQTLFVGQPDSIHTSAVEGITSCWGGNDGTIDLSVSGGTAPYLYAWSSGETGQDVSNAETGLYTVTVTDDHGCKKVSVYHVGTMSEVVINSTVIQVSCSDNSDGQIALTVAGGAGDYDYLWSNAATNYQISNLEPGTYSVTVTDLNGCSKMMEYTLPESETACINIPSSFTPNSDGKNDDWVINNIELYSWHRVQIFNRWGNLLYEQSPYTTPWDGKFNGNPLPAETYYYIIDLNNGQEAFTGTVTIIR